MFARQAGGQLPAPKRLSVQPVAVGHREDATDAQHGRRGAAQGLLLVKVVPSGYVKIAIEHGKL